MKKVLLIAPISTTTWGSANAGGVDSVAQSIVQTIQDRPQSKYIYRIAAIDPHSNHGYRSKPVQLSTCLDFVYIPANEYFGKIRIPGLISQSFRVLQEISRFQPDVVHSHGLNWLIGVSKTRIRIASLHAYKKIGRNSVSLLNDILYESFIPPVSNRFVDFYTCVGEGLEAALSRDVQKPVRIIDNPIDQDFFKGNRIEAEEFDHFSLVTCAIITRRKRIELGIQLVKDLNDRGHPTKLTVIGKIADQQYYNELLRHIESLEISHLIHFSGHLPRPAIIEQYQKADLGVFTSSDETFGLAPLEMLAAGLPVYTTRVGIIESRQDEFHMHGVRYWSDDVGERVDTVLKLINRKFNEGCRNWMKKQFSPESILNRYEALYDELLSKEFKDKMLP